MNNIIQQLETQYQQLEITQNQLQQKQQILEQQFTEIQNELNFDIQQIQALNTEIPRLKNEVNNLQQQIHDKQQQKLNKIKINVDESIDLRNELLKAEKFMMKWNIKNIDKGNEIDFSSMTLLDATVNMENVLFIFLGSDNSLYGLFVRDDIEESEDVKQRFTYFCLTSSHGIPFCINDKKRVKIEGNDICVENVVELKNNELFVFDQRVNNMVRKRLYSLEVYQL